METVRGQLHELLAMSERNIPGIIYSYVVSAQFGVIFLWKLFLFLIQFACNNFHFYSSVHICALHDIAIVCCLSIHPSYQLGYFASNYTNN